MMDATTKITPMLRQYLEIKEQYSGEILFYRMGDFYEMFFDDAVTAAKILNITLTSRNNKGDTAKIPMCGVPHHAAQAYIAKLVQSGRRVAICEQTEDPSEAKGIVRREVTRVVSPGIITDDQLLDGREHCFIAAVAPPSSSSGIWGVSFLDLSTGTYLMGEFSDRHNPPESILDQLIRIAPAELLVNGEQSLKIDDFLKAVRLRLPGICITERFSDFFAFEPAHSTLLEHFHVASLSGFGCDDMQQATIAAAVLLDYVRETQKTSLAHLEKLEPIEIESVLQIDESSRRNLELTHTIVGNRRDGSLLAVLDRTGTPMGARLLKQMTLNPLQDRQRIINRLDGVAFFYAHPSIRHSLRDILTSVYDIERLNSRMVLGHANARDALALKASFARLPDLHELLRQCTPPRLQEICTTFDTCTDLHHLLEQAIHEDPPVTLRDGNLIKPGFNDELDELNSLLRDGKKLILSLENDERQKTGIAKLKIGYNKVFGYFIEVSNANLDKVPDWYIRKQTLVNAERFITPELKEFESRVLNAQERKLDLEYRLFSGIREQLAAHSSRLRDLGQALAFLDVFASLAETAHLCHYVRPDITEGSTIEIIEGRHPVIERALPSGSFVPNDVLLDQTDNQMIIITGPNMAGKSTVLRQTALIVLMAQMGSFVPAERASICVVDRIFTRVGAMDDLRRGQSTFMVEMSETANILNNATSRSLVILDEIGRGTSTYDGLAIAWSVAEALLEKDESGVKTMFATHYHELTDLARTRAKVQNLSVAVKEWNDRIIFLHKLVRGGTSRSYGIQVAALAGVPALVVKRAGEILKQIDRGDFEYQLAGSKLAPKTASTPGRAKPNQLQLFKEPGHPIIQRIQDLRPDEMSPRQALDILYQLQKMISGHET